MRFEYYVRDAADFSWAWAASRSLVIVDQFNVESIFPFKTENDAPVGPHSDRPEASQPAFERMQAIAGKIERLGRRGLIETGQNIFYVLQQVGSYPAPVVAFEESFQTPVLKAPDHQSNVK